MAEQTETLDEATGSAGRLNFQHTHNNELKLQIMLLFSKAMEQWFHIRPHSHPQSEEGRTCAAKYDIFFFHGICPSLQHIISQVTWMDDEQGGLLIRL